MLLAMNISPLGLMVKMHDGHDESGNDSLLRTAAGCACVHAAALCDRGSCNILSEEPEDRHATT